MGSYSNPSNLVTYLAGGLAARGVRFKPPDLELISGGLAGRIMGVLKTTRSCGLISLGGLAGRRLIRPPKPPGMLVTYSREGLAGDYKVFQIIKILAKHSREGLAFAENYGRYSKPTSCDLLAGLAAENYGIFKPTRSCDLLAGGLWPRSE
ncbi:hypothetical protein NPIL_79271 [Nephila pilipes]|uniref:Uncharacterized protein n=1 Tax=Nephila pilipes TaxID=299642 RepID=A0A8X6NZJ7_NEPPI|nr:hypothetical protein NPIL_79271 [Nephila pilipes]